MYVFMEEPILRDWALLEWLVDEMMILWKLCDCALFKGTMHQKYDVVLKYAKLIPILASVIIFAKFSKYSPPATKRDKIGLLFHLLFLIF